jgi:hypothetical protein
MAANSISSPSPPIGFVWFASDEAKTLLDAAENEARAFGLNVTALDLAVAACLQVVDRFRSGQARSGSDYRRIAGAKDLPLFELRAAVVGAEAAQARIYFVWPDETKAALGVLLRFKRLDGDREQIRAWQNKDIAGALALARQAIEEMKHLGG